MRIFAVLFLTIISFISVNAQTSEVTPASTKEIKTTEPDFKNAGEQERYWAAETFKAYYQQQYYNTYKGEIIVNGNSYKYNKEIIIVYADPEFGEIFKKGIFYPGIIAESFKYGPKFKIRLMKDTTPTRQKKDTSAAMQKAFYYMIRTDTLKIFNFEELKFLETTPTEKRFRFWLSSKRLVNPTVYFMELTNQNAAPGTDMPTFINGATLTFFWEGWIII
jgi:hypothetical protein